MHSQKSALLEFEFSPLPPLPPVQSFYSQIASGQDKSGYPVGQLRDVEIDE